MELDVSEFLRNEQKIHPIEIGTDQQHKRRLNSLRLIMHYLIINYLMIYLLIICIARQCVTYN